MKSIAFANGVRFPRHLIDGVHQFKDFSDFFKQNDMVRACFLRPEDFRQIAFEFCEDEAAQGTRYAEVTFSAAAHGERTGDPEMPLVSVLEGLAAGYECFGIRCQLILDHSRRRSVERARRTLELARRYSNEGVVAIGLAGDENFSAMPFAEIFALAREWGLHVVHHAGEACGPESVWEAIRVGLAERIGHGIRIVEDAELIAELRRRNIPLEVCPSSNVALGFATGWENHPLPQLRNAGLVTTINTDIPALVGTTLIDEYRRARAIFGYDDEDLAELTGNAISASFAPAALKEQLWAETQGWLGYHDHRIS